MEDMETPKVAKKGLDPSAAHGASSLMGLFAPPLESENSQQQQGRVVNEQSQSDQQRVNPQTPGATSYAEVSESSEDAAFYDALQEEEHNNKSNINQTNGDDVAGQRQHTNGQGSMPLNNDNENQITDEDRRPTVVRSNANKGPETLQLQTLFDRPLERPQDDAPVAEATPLLQQQELPHFTSTSYMKPTFAAPAPSNVDNRLLNNKYRAMPMPCIDEHAQGTNNNDHSSIPQSPTERFYVWTACTSKYVYREFTQPWTWIGGAVYLLYHTVFALTMGSSLQRPHGGTSMLGLIAKMAAGGVIFGSPVYWICIGSIPSLYATIDLFAAPFFADIVLKVDAALDADPAVKDLPSDENDLIFLGTFSLLAQFSIFLTGCLVTLASVFKLANLGSFLPFPVLAGFFAAVAVLMWQLAFKIDANGANVGAVLMSGDVKWIATCFLHHAPSFATALLMKELGPKHPFFVAGLLLTSIGAFYVVMFAFGISRDQAVEHGWFWATSDLVYEPLNAPIGFKDWVVPAPFGWIKSLFHYKYIHWGAFQSGLGTAVALAFLYLIRCSLHCPAVRKNLSNLVRPEKDPDVTSATTSTRTATTPSNAPVSGLEIPQPLSRRGRAFSDAVDLERNIGLLKSTRNALSMRSSSGVVMVQAKPTHHGLPTIMAAYGYSQLVCAIFGFMCIVPNIATASTMYKVRAEKVAPQFLACVFLLFLYLFDFRMVGYIPKTSFSSLLTLASIENFLTFGVNSYTRTKEKLEWLVVPLIVVLCFVVGLLNAVFLGLAISTFIFVASFFRSGVVKFISNGAVIRSTIERQPQSALFLDENGELIQLLVLQNYLFFGNSSSLVTFIGSMFEEVEGDEALLPPIPKIVILDLTLVSGVDTSAVDVFTEILNLCSQQDCKLFMAGVSTRIRQTMQLGGFSPNTKLSHADRELRFFPDLDAAIGKAEDMLLTAESFEDQISHGGRTGFLHALEHIDQQHLRCCSKELEGLEPYMKVLSMEPGQVLYTDIDAERGLFFIEHGILKVEQSSHDTMTRTGRISFTDHRAVSLNALKARSFGMHQQVADREERMFRIARIGPGWVLGVTEFMSGDSNPGEYIAVSHCVLHHISYSAIAELEKSQPLLILKLQKLLSYLMAKRQAVTINQLTTLHSILNSAAHKKPVRRVQYS